ncbi:MAG: hypothetical protein N4A71_15415 [Carboxylicivirga sp.]|jgi:hypothetical protein|nr:hypothetical protein [Carboxylicivirga sp.]
MKRLPWLQIGKGAVIALSLIGYAFIAYRLFNFEYWDILIANTSLSLLNAIYLSLLLLLWFANLLAESKKWQILMQAFTSISLRDAWRQVMAGTTTAVGSPSRIAEMGGRMALLDKDQRVNGAIMTTIGGIFQNIVILLVGVACLIYMPHKDLQLHAGINYSIFLILPVLLIIVFSIIFILFKNKVRYYTKVLKHLQAPVVAQSFFYTIARYLVYCIQLFLWMKFWGLNISISDYLSLAPLYFLFITILPSHILVDIGIRGSVAIFLFSTVTNETPLIFLAIFSLWVTNVVFPTIIGSYTLVKNK